MPLQRLQHRGLDLVLLLAQELLGGRLKEVGVLHYLDLDVAGKTKETSVFVWKLLIIDIF